jgi:hypothetical protein
MRSRDTDAFGSIAPEGSRSRLGSEVEAVENPSLNQLIDFDSRLSGYRLEAHCSLGLKPT